MKMITYNFNISEFRIFVTDDKNGNILIHFNMDNLLVTNITQLASYYIVFLKYKCDLHHEISLIAIIFIC